MDANKQTGTDGDDEVAGAASAPTSAKEKPNYAGPLSGVKYPLNVIYCGECSLPTDLCEYSPNPEACKDWLQKNHPDFYAKLNNLQLTEGASGTAEAADGDKKSASSSHQKRGGKAQPKSKKERQPCKVIITKNQRKGNKYVTIITGLAGNDIDLEQAKKFFAQRFSCGCSKGDDELTIQGDVVDALFDVIPEKYPQISADMIEEKEKP